MPTNFTLGKCTTRAGYSAKLKTSRKLNLTAIKKTFQVLLETPILLVIKTEAGEVIVHGYGELLFKESKDMDLMEKVAEKIYTVGLPKNSETFKQIMGSREDIKAGRVKKIASARDLMKEL